MTGTAQRVTLIARAEGAELAEHDSPPAATLHVVTGRVRLHTHDHEQVLDRGHLTAIPPQRHGLTALADSAVLLTVASDDAAQLGEQRHKLPDCIIVQLGR